MTTNLKSIAGTDFDDLFEAGAGNQLLNIYAMDGQDVGQKYLNVSQGSQVSASTGFQASDSADVKTKLCGKGTNKISYTLRYLNPFGRGFELYLTISGMPTGNSCTVTGQVAYQKHDDSGEDNPYIRDYHDINRKITSNGEVLLWSDSVPSGYCQIYHKNQTITLAYMGRSVVIAVPIKHNQFASGTL